MKYNISSPSAPKMPNLGKGTECIKLLLSQTSKDMHQLLVPMLFPVLGAHICASEFQYPDLSWKEMCGMMANLVAESGGNKGQLGMLVEAICRDFRTHDKDDLVQEAWLVLMELPDSAVSPPPTGGTEEAILPKPSRFSVSPVPPCRTLYGATRSRAYLCRKTTLSNFLTTFRRATPLSNGEPFNEPQKPFRLMRSN